jgi:hypothetical protein
MGGLDARHLFSSRGFGDRVKVLATFCTPHLGSAMADMTLGLLPKDDDALAGFARLLGQPLGDASLAATPDVRAVFTALAESSADGFNRQNPEDSRVRYLAWAGLSNVLGIPNSHDEDACDHNMPLFPADHTRHVMHPQLAVFAGVVAHGTEMRPHDGLVTVASARYATGPDGAPTRFEFRGCLPSDHLDEVGTDDVPGQPSQDPFAYARFYRGLAFELVVN